MTEEFILSKAISSSSDEALISRCRAGDADAFREVYHRHRKGVYRVVARMLSNEADQEEVSQDVFLQIFRSLPSFQGTSKLSTWIHRLTMNVVLQHIRRKRSRIKLSLVEAPPDQTSSSLHNNERPMTPEDRVCQSQRKAAVQRALDCLSPKKRAALVLHDLEGIPTKEISKIVGAPILTIRTRLFYARKDFYNTLMDEPSFKGTQLGPEDNQ